MQYRRLGKTNEMVSALGFGCMRLPLLSGGDTSKINEEKAIAMIRYAIDQGVNYIDTAYPYHSTDRSKGGASEPLVAKALKDGYREKVNVATKLPSWLIKTREDMDRYLNEQLKRLEVECIDFYLVHTINTEFWDTLKKAEMGDFLDQAIRDGKIRYAGFSFHDKLPLFKEVADFYDWSFCQIQYNYLDENFQAGTEGLKYAADKDLGIVIMEPLRGGKLVDLPEEAQMVLERSQKGRTAADWGLRWVWNHPEAGVVLSGMSTMGQVEENLKSAETSRVDSMSEEELAQVEEVKGILREKMRIGCTACEYCLPCPQGVWIPGIFDAYNHYVISKDGNMPTYFASISPEQASSRCIQCGLCEQHCPQGIAIIKELKKITNLVKRG